MLTDKSRLLKIVGLLFIVGWMSFYPIYTAFYRAEAIEQYERHIAHMEGHAMFFNPWQYRVLCPLIIEGMYQVLDHTLFPLFNFQFNPDLQGDLSGKNEATQKLMANISNPEFVKYNIVFVLFRMIENVVVFWLAFIFFLHFVKDRSLVYIAILLLALFMGNSVVDSDYTHNTYMDLIVYLLAALVIVKEYNIWWIVPISIIGSLNRETSILIPALVFCSKTDWKKWPNILGILLGDKRLFWTTGLSYIAFGAVFVLVRIYYGYEPQSTWRVAAGWPMIKLNLFSSASLKTYMEWFGVFGFLPFWSIFLLRRTSKTLQIFFWVIVPVWFLVHVVSAIGFQSRLYLVPTILVFIPIVFQDIYQRFIGSREAQVTNSIK